MPVNIGTGSGGNKITRGQKAAETRANNTKAEVEYIAKTYFEFLQFARSTGISELQLANTQFDNLIKGYIQLGKIKQESYNKFKSFLQNSNINPLSMTKTAFIKVISDGFDSSIINVNSDVLSNLENDFYKLLSVYNITMPDIVKKALFIQLGGSIAELYKDKSLIDYFFHTLANRYGLSKVHWRNPEVLVEESDGCTGSRDIYAPLCERLDKLR